MKILRNIIYGLVILALVLIAGSSFLSVSQAPGGFRLFVVQSGSMEPALKTGSVVLIAPEKEYQKGDIISFLTRPEAEVSEAAVITHRVDSISENEGELSYITKGDANKKADQEKVLSDQVLGEVKLTIPFLGYAVDFAKTQLGVIILIVIPGTIIVYSELLNIKNELVKIYSRKKESAENK